MNRLETVIIDQYERIKAADAEPIEALAEAQGEILDVATPDLTVDIIIDQNRTHLWRENHSVNSILRAQQDPLSILNRSIMAIRNANGLAGIDMIAPRQGYTGGILFDYEDPIVFGQSASQDGKIKTDDPIQEAMGDTFYPPMMWVKALRAEAFKNRPESAQEMTIAEYLGNMGLSLGSATNAHGDLLGATGFMPGRRLAYGWDDHEVIEHMESEVVPAFRLSGMCDQAVLDPEGVMRDPSWFASTVFMSSGSLN